jgi:glycosyltransferase involved in cell wall biosynthesis
MDGPIAHINLARTFRGGERQTELLVRGLAERGYAQRLIARGDAPLAPRLSDVPRLDVRPASGLWSAARACGGDTAIIHTHEGRAPQAAWWVRTRHRTPYVITRRVDAPLKRNPFTRGVYRRAGRVVAISKAIANLLAEYEPRLRIEVVPSALAHLPERPEAVARLRERYAGRFVVGHVGALVDRHKGQTLLIEVARRVERTHPDLHFVLVGDGEDEAMLRARCAGLANVEMTGFVDDVASHLAAFDLVALPSRYEGLGSVLLDAMDHGKAIVAARVGGIPEVVADGDNGLLFEAGDVDGLERAILALHGDRARLRAMGERGRVRSLEYAPARMVDRYIEVYSSVLKETER